MLAPPSTSTAATRTGIAIRIPSQLLWDLHEESSATGSTVHLAICLLALMGGRKSLRISDHELSKLSGRSPKTIRHHRPALSSVFRIERCHSNQSFVWTLKDDAYWLPYHRAPSVSFAQLPVELLHKLTPAEVAAWTAVASFCTSDGAATTRHGGRPWPKVWIRNRSCLSASTWHRSINALIEKGLISRHNHTLHVATPPTKPQNSIDLRNQRKRICSIRRASIPRGSFDYSIRQPHEVSPKDPPFVRNKQPHPAPPERPPHESQPRAPNQPNQRDNRRRTEPANPVLGWRLVETALHTDQTTGRWLVCSPTKLAAIARSVGWAAATTGYLTTRRRMLTGTTYQTPAAMILTLGRCYRGRCNTNQPHGHCGNNAWIDHRGQNADWYQDQNNASRNKWVLAPPSSHLV